MPTLQKMPILISYAYARNDISTFEQLAYHPKIDLMLDSGAFTAKNTGKPINLDDYCSFLDKYKQHLFSYIMLDVLNDPKASLQNLHAMLSSGYRPMPVHVFGDGQHEMDYLFSVSDYVALGGMKRASGGPAPKPYVKAIMQWARGRRVHWLGYTQDDLIQTFRPFSVDSSSWRAGVRFGVIRYYIGNGSWVPTTYNNRGKLLKAPGFKQRLRQMGYGLHQFNDPGCWKQQGQSCLLLDIPSDSYVRYAKDLFARFGARYFLVHISANPVTLIQSIERNF